MALSDAEVRNINLIEILEEEYPSVLSPPAESASEWSQEEIRAYFASSGTVAPPSRNNKASPPHAYHHQARPLKKTMKAMMLHQLGERLRPPCVPCTSRHRCRTVDPCSLARHRSTVIV
eukprot:5013108-Pyramimonas_sp.AAC.3